MSVRRSTVAVLSSSAAERDADWFMRISNGPSARNEIRVRQLEVMKRHPQVAEQSVYLVDPLVSEIVGQIAEIAVYHGQPLIVGGIGYSSAS